jgi:hypothetical protein
VTVFRVIGDEIRLVLEVGAKFLPEMIDLDGDGTTEILISHGDWLSDKGGRRIFKKTKTSIYKLQNTKYVETKTVRFEERFTAFR